MRFSTSCQLLACFAASLLVVGADKEGNENLSISQLACSTEGFETLCSAIVAAGLWVTLNGGEWTVFAPTNDAFAALDPAYLDAVSSTTASLVNLLSYHAIVNATISSMNLNCGGFITMANGLLSETVCLNNVQYQAGIGNAADALPEIIATNVKASNGIIQVVDQVLLPEKVGCKTITDLACTTVGFETLCVAIGAAGLDEALSGGTWTVFAPTNDAFDALDPVLLESLLNDTAALTDVLTFHAVAGTAISSDSLVCGGSVEMANGVSSTTICQFSKVYQVGPGNTRDAWPEVIATDIEACNGVVHVVDQVLLPA